MTHPTLDAPTRRAGFDLLGASGKLWFLVAAAGQGAFVYFLLAFYGRRTLAGDYPAWNDKPLIDGYIAGDTAGNVMFIAHALLAAVVTVGGLIQMVPVVRRRAAMLHRWNGRVFLVIALFMALGGIWLTNVRGTQLSSISAAAITVNGILILIAATFAWRLALARRFAEHRIWAMRTFLLVNGVWFLRVAIMAWVLLNQGPVGMNQTLSGPADVGLVFGCYLVPLAVLEVYLRAQRSNAFAFKLAAALLVVVMTGIMAVGIFGTVAIMWGPYL